MPSKKQQIANQTIFTGDNLDIMRGMDSESVDLIYLDPPFNSNRHYEAPIGSKAAGAEFKDAWTFEDTKEAWWGLIADEHPALYKVIDAAGDVGNEGDKAYLIYMAMRLLEMRRILKPTGSIYLHCDDVMSHSLKMVMDAIFGRKNYQNEITWKRNSSHNDAKRFGRVADSILFYGAQINKDSVRVPLNPDYVKQFYRYEDKRGVYRVGDLTAKGLSGGGYDYEFHGHRGPWRYPEKRMMELEKKDLIYLPKKKNGVPGFKRYLHENKGQVPPCIWTDIPPLSKKERTGYPTQKPLALLRRVIEASSSAGDVVLDPFCGCATACLAAQDLERQWIGIDISPLAETLIKQRMEDELGMFGHVTHREDIPTRSDQLKPPSKDINHTLFGKQEGKCNGCGHSFPFQNFTRDHIIPTAKGGQDTDDNLQLLCGRCNSIKGARPMEYLVGKLTDDGTIQKPAKRR